MQISQLSKILPGQDGAIFGDRLFRFTSNARGYLYNIISENGELSFELVNEFTLDKADILMPHSNAVFFGTEYYAPGDEFPVLYTNIYNSYPSMPERCGVLCAYRIRIVDGAVETELVQVLKVGFTDNKALWRSEAEKGDVRPYGNFAMDKENARIYAFTMRDLPKTTAYFAFNAPSVKDGVYSQEIDATVYTFTEKDIVSSFEDEYTKYMQGAIIHKGILYSVEGFTSSEVNVPAIRRIDLLQKKQIDYVNLTAAGYPIEPEFIDFYGEECIYIDASGNVFKMEY